MEFEFKLRRRIEFAETDMAGIVHFSNFFRMREVTEHAFLRSLGFTVHGEGEGGTTGWPRVSVSCDYFRPLRFEDEVEIHLLVSEVRNRSLRYQFVFRKVGEEAEVARGAVAAVCATVDKATGKLGPVPIPEALRAKLVAAPVHLLESRPPVTA